MSERPSNVTNKIVLEMVAEVKKDTSKVNEDMGDLKVALAEIRRDILNMPELAREKHKIIEQRMDFQDEKIEANEREIKNLKSSLWGLAAATLLMFINAVWQLVIK